MNDLVTRLKNLLTWNELDVLKAVYRVIDGRSECLISITDITKEKGIQRSTVANMLRIIEAAGVIESKSAGMKGTYIKVLDHDILKAVIE